MSSKLAVGIASPAGAGVVASACAHAVEAATLQTIVANNRQEVCIGMLAFAHVVSWYNATADVVPRLPLAAIRLAKS
jgi:hypothetical protein